ncbi:MAG TPA: DEAD/DEAH box helicase [Candidatus Thermoplasmatota archaeon]|nr:DEAD/DEAH box helicase [Candidatus Thermoplasmatota archaeon]
MAEAPKQVEGAFRLLLPQLQQFLEAEGFTRPTAAQEAAIPSVLSGKHTLLIAPTGMGKTESAVIPLFNRLLEWKHEAPEKDRKGIHLIYVTPLRALNRDLMARLHTWGKALGLDVRVRHGDTSQSERNRQSRNPPDVLITTPETVQVLLTGSRLREALTKLKYVVIDEVHELAQDERGAQLGIGLERLCDLAGEVQRVGLSATVGRDVEVAAYVGGPSRHVEIVKVPVAKELQLMVESPEPGPADIRTASKLMCKPDAAAYLNRALELVEEYRQTLLFVNTRETAEVLTARVRMLDAEYPLGVHHGSLSKDARVSAEEQFKRGILRGLISTSSMELGIDVGAVDLVVQYGSPRQVTRLVQRVGRAGHRHDLTSNGVLLTTEPDDTIEALVIARRTKGEALEVFSAPRKPLDVLANQLVALTVERKRMSAREAHRMVTKTHSFANLLWDEFEETLKQIQQQGLVWYENGEFGSRKRSREYLYENISMIPDSKTFRVVNMVTNRAVATLDEAFVASFIEPGASFIAQGQAWRVAEIVEDKDELRVEPIKDPLGAIPSWIGEEIPVPWEVAQEVGALRGKLRQLMQEGGEAEAERYLLVYYHASESAARKVVAYVKEQGHYVLPTDKMLTLDVGEGTVVINCCFGSKVNETLGRLLSGLLTARLGTSTGLQVDPYRIILTVPGRTSPTTLRDMILQLDPETVEPLMIRLLSSSHYLRQRMVHVARKFGALEREVDYKKISLARLMDAFKGTPLYREAMREVFEDKLDAEKTKEVLKSLRAGEMELIVQELSPIGAAGIDTRIELVSPARADKTLLEALRKRLENERAMLACLNCREWSAETRAGRALERRQCPECKARMITIFRPWNDMGKKAATKKGPLTPEEKGELKRLQTAANLIMDHGAKAILALMARGVGPDVAGRILYKQRSDEDAFLRDLLEAEVTYARTRQFWD